MNEQVAVLGVTVQPWTRTELLRAIEEGVDRGEKLVIPHHNLHSAALKKRHSALAVFFRDHPRAHVDGMPLVLWGRLLGLPLREEHRITYVDLIGPLMELAVEKDLQVFHIGGKPGVGERAAGVLAEKYGIRVAVQHGFFEPEEEAGVLRQVHRLRPQLVLVGMGMPRQELWLHQHLPDLPAAVYLCSGGCFDYLAGEQKVPPRWSGRVGLEWLFRLVNEPRRLGWRYLVEPITLLPEVLADLRAAFRRG